MLNLYRFFFLRIRPPPESTPTYTLIPYTTLFRSPKPVRNEAPGGRAERCGKTEIQSKNQSRLRQIHTMAAHQQGNEKQIEPEADKPNQSAATSQVQASGRFAQPPQDRTEGRSAIVLPCRCPRRFRHCPKQNKRHNQTWAHHRPEGKPPPQHPN